MKCTEFFTNWYAEHAFRQITFIVVKFLKKIVRKGLQNQCHYHAKEGTRLDNATNGFWGDHSDSKFMFLIHLLHGI